MTHPKPGGAHDGNRLVVFVEQFYFPDGWGGAELPRDLTIHLAERGLQVEVICGSEPYAPVEGDPGRDPSSHGVRVRRIPAMADGDIHSRKLLRQLHFCLRLIPQLLFRRRPGLFVSQTNPPLVVLLVAFFARIARRPYLLIAMDIYPEVLVAHGALARTGTLTRVLHAVFGWAYRSATAVVALGPVMRKRLRAKGVAVERIVEIPNWATGSPGVRRGADNRLRAEWHLAKNFVLVYSGNLGIGHEFQTLLDAFALAYRHNGSLKMVIIGQGSRLQEVRDQVRDLGIEAAVLFSGFVSSDQLPETMGLADLGVVTLRPGFEGLIVPSKLVGYLSRGVPVVYVGPHSDVDEVLTRYSGGISVRNGEPELLSELLLELASSPAKLAAMGEAGRQGYEREISRLHALERYEAIVNHCLEGGGPCHS